MTTEVDMSQFFKLAGTAASMAVQRGRLARELEMSELQGILKAPGLLVSQAHRRSLILSPC